MQESEMNTRIQITIPLVLFISAFALRLYAALVPGIIVPDGIMYINTAKLIEAGEWNRITQYSFYNLYPFIITIFHKIIPDWEFSARFLSVLSGSAAIIPFYWIIKRLFKVKLAVIASIFFIISPRLVEYSSNVIREPLFWFLALSALSAALAGIQRKSPVFMVLSAIFVGLSAFTRMEGVALIPVILFWSFWLNLQEKKFNYKAFIIFSMVFLLSFPVMFFSPLAYIKVRVGHWEFGHVGSKIPQMLAAGNKSTEQTFQKNIEESDVVTRLLSGHKYLVFLWQSIFKFFRSYHLLFIFFFIVGIIRRKAVPFSPNEILLWSWFLAFFAVSLLYVSKIYYLSTRHGMLMGFPAFLWVATGFCEIVNLLEKKWERLNAALTSNKINYKMVVISMAVVCAIVLPSSLSWSGADKVELKKAGYYLKNAGYSGKKLAVEGRLNRLGFYSGAEYYTIPENISAADIKIFLKSSDADYLIIDTRTMGRSIAALIDDPDNRFTRLHINNEFSSYRNYSFILFSLKQ